MDPTLPMDTRQVHSILLLMGESHGIVSAFENADFLKFIEVFSQQWSLLNDMEREEQRRLELKQSLTDIERDSAQRSLANALSRTLIGESAAMQSCVSRLSLPLTLSSRSWCKVKLARGKS